jgi:hypothetical protein
MVDPKMGKLDLGGMMALSLSHTRQSAQPPTKSQVIVRQLVVSSGAEGGQCGVGPITEGPNDGWSGSPNNGRGMTDSLPAGEQQQSQQPAGSNTANCQKAGAAPSIAPATAAAVLGVAPTTVAAQIPQQQPLDISDKLQPLSLAHSGVAKLALPDEKSQVAATAAAAAAAPLPPLPPQRMSSSNVGVPAAVTTGPITQAQAQQHQQWQRPSSISHLTSGAAAVGGSPPVVPVVVAPHRMSSGSLPDALCDTTAPGMETYKLTGVWRYHMGVWGCTHAHAMNGWLVGWSDTWLECVSVCPHCENMGHVAIRVVNTMN